MPLFIERESMIHSLFQQLLILLATSVAVVAIFRRFKLPPILGYLCVGVLAGPSGPDWISTFSNLHVLAKFGVVFLLFTIGLELSLPRLAAMRSALLKAGSLQVIICILIAWVIAIICGLSLSNSFITAGAIALSSTAIASKLLAEAGAVNTPRGQLSLSILIFQDLATIPLLIIATSLSQGSSDHILQTTSIELAKGVATFIVLVFVGHWVVSRLFHEISRSRSSELFLLTALCIALAAAWVTDLMGLSMELGAFLAGVILGGTPYHHQVSSDIRPFRDTLLGLFFIGMGSLVNLHELSSFTVWVILIAVAIVLIKAIVIYAVVRLTRQANSTDAFKTGILLSQGGEFGFVLISIETNFNTIDDHIAQVMLGALMISMVISIILVRFQKPLLTLFHKLTERSTNPSSLPTKPANTATTLKDHVIICGFSRVGQRLARAVESEGFNYIAIDLDPLRIEQAALAGENIFYGDATQLDTLRHAGITQAKALVITYTSPASSVKKSLRLIQHITPNLDVLVRAKNDALLEEYREEGATEVVSEALESSLMLGSHLMLMLGVPKHRVMSWLLNIRKNRYDLLSGFFKGQEAETIESDESMREQLSSFFLPEGSFAIDRTLKELKLEDFSVTVTSIRRSGIRGAQPEPDTRLKAQDILVLYGTPENIERAEAKLIGNIA
ncbi:monovalent cation:proton antiporter family protein [Piscirickettsia salmonis]|uniref:monovalent cation:proton antiporter family protein n=2 Tax=Piscirickettsia salmonis TaxID=1238 RepID=UPI001E4D4B51|nr:monovalent cation:proton antiporter family protein [Piscirickettsia salmonis]